MYICNMNSKNSNSKYKYEYLNTNYSYSNNLILNEYTYIVICNKVGLITRWSNIFGYRMIILVFNIESIFNSYIMNYLILR